MRVCVIGAGASGLVAIKELKELGHTVKCFEQQNDIGGVFLYGNDKGGVYDSTLLTVSNYFMAFSSFPPAADEKRRFWHHREYVDYLAAFCEHFGLLNRIQFNVEVKRVTKVGRGFKVDVEADGQIRSEQFDAVAVCSGTHQLANLPKFPGSDKFKGEIAHTESYKNADNFAGKRVVCVGIGESAGDVLHEVAQVAAHCTLSIRHYPHIVARFPLYDNENPSDALSSRTMHMHRKGLEDVVKLEQLYSSLSATEDDVRIKAQWCYQSESPYSQFLTKTDRFLPDVASGLVKVNPAGISHLSEDSVHFNDGSSVKTDVIICCTGYEDRFPFITDVQVTDVRRQLYKHTFHPEFGQRLAFIGFARPDLGGFPAVAELQSRYFALLCSGELKLPRDALLDKTILREASIEEERFNISPGVRSLVSYSHFTDELAEMIGCLPGFAKMLFNPKLLYLYHFGSQVGSHFRLSGPAADSEAAEGLIRRLSVVYPWTIIALLFRYTVICWIFQIFGINSEEYRGMGKQRFVIFQSRFIFFAIMMLHMFIGILALNILGQCLGASNSVGILIMLCLALYVGHDLGYVATWEKNQMRRAAKEAERLDALRK